MRKTMKQTMTQTDFARGRRILLPLAVVLFSSLLWGQKSTTAQPANSSTSSSANSSAPTRPARTATSPATSSYEGDGESGASAGTTTMIDDQGHKIKSGIPPRTPGKLS